VASGQLLLFPSWSLDFVYGSSSQLLDLRPLRLLMLTTGH